MAMPRMPPSTRMAIRVSSRLMGPTGQGFMPLLFKLQRWPLFMLLHTFALFSDRPVSANTRTTRAHTARSAYHTPMTASVAAIDDSSHGRAITGDAASQKEKHGAGSTDTTVASVPGTRGEGLTILDSCSAAAYSSSRLPNRS